jgi:four helix bundle protein
MKENPVLEKSFAFALRIIKLNRYLVEEKKEFVLSKELLVSGTHIGKHIKEATDGESRQIFVNEMVIARRGFGNRILASAFVSSRFPDRKSL